MKKPIIVFDLDGTLIDTAPDLLRSLAYCLEDSGLPPVDPALFHAYLGFGGRAIIDRAFRLAQRELNTKQADQLVDKFLAHYSENLPGVSKPFPGALACIDRFQQAGWLAAICTNKWERLAHGLIDGLALSHLFAANCGADSFPHRKPDPRHLLMTIDAANGDAERAIMVGDSNTDIATAKACGIPVIAVDFGYSDQPVASYEPSRVISHYDELSLAMADDLIAATQ